MKIARVHLRNANNSPMSWSRFHNTPKLERESHDDHEKRTWNQRFHKTADGRVMIPPTAFKNCLDGAAKYLGLKIPGKGNSTYTKHFVAGVLVVEPLILDVQAESLPGDWVFVPANGVKGDGKRVTKCFPMLYEWEGTVEFHIYDDTVTRSVFERVLENAGQFIGLGRFRPQNGGYYGRFDILDIDWIEDEVELAA